MPEFLNPFSGVVPERKMTKEELVRAIRLNLSAEEEAIHLYLAHADATDNELAARVLRDVADEERQHAGEFLRLLNILLDDEGVLMAKGAQEVDQMANALKGGAKGPAGLPKEAPERDIPTVGNLKA